MHDAMSRESNSLERYLILVIGVEAQTSVKGGKQSFSYGVDRLKSPLLLITLI